MQVHACQRCVLMCHFNITYAYISKLIMFGIVNANVSMIFEIVLIGFLRCVRIFLFDLTGRPVSSLLCNVSLAVTSL